jgi:hypothetical protein
MALYHRIEITDMTIAAATTTTTTMTVRLKCPIFPEGGEGW